MYFQIEPSERMWPPTPLQQQQQGQGQLGPIGGSIGAVGQGHGPQGLPLPPQGQGPMSMPPADQLMMSQAMMNPLLDGPLFNMTSLDPSSGIQGMSMTSSGNPLDLGGLNLGFSLFNDLADMTWVNNAPVSGDFGLCVCSLVFVCVLWTLVVLCTLLGVH